jgi:hypothetical protein
MALKRSLTKVGRVLEDIANEFHKHGEFVSMPDEIQTAKEQAKITSLTNFNKIFLLTQMLW